jgi:hypothetical protein
MPQENPDETLAQGATSEYERYLVDLERVLQGVALFDIDSDNAETTKRDLDLLAVDTGINRQHLTWLITAVMYGKQSQSIDAKIRGNVFNRSVATAVFYGWFRQGVPTEIRTLWATPTDTLFTALKASIEQQIVPPISNSMKDSVRERIEQIKLDLVLKTPANLGELLATLPVPLTLTQQRAIIAAIADLRPDDPQLVKRIAEVSGFDGDAIAVASALRLGALTGCHLAMVQALQLRLQAEESDGTLRPLAALRPDEWLDLVYTHGTPGEITITPDAYADALSVRVERYCLTAAREEHLRDRQRLE